MKRRLPDLLGWSGRVNGRTYLLVGLVLSALKLATDWTVVRLLFDREWGLRKYAFPGELFGLQDLTREDRTYYLALATIALPFVAIGVSMTVRRLRDTRLPVWLVPLFFLPLPFNLIFFVTLAAWPSRPPDEALDPIDAPYPGEKLLIFEPEPPRTRLGAWLPENDVACGAFSIGLTLPLAFLLGVLSVRVMETYGWGLFVGLPFGLPMAAVMIFGQRKRRTLHACLNLGTAWFVAAFLTLLLFAFEGLVCLVLLIPLAYPICLLGAWAGYYAQLLHWPLRSPRAILLLLASLPTLIGAEAVIPRTPPLFPVTTTVEVDAPPETVWKHVVEFSSLPEPDDWVFRTGVAYPLRATIEGRGPGAVRHCVFSTGAFVEPIEVWDEPRLLRFSVTSNPPPMKEWSPFADITPPHLHNYLVSKKGQFLLRPLPGGRTRLEGTTWYHHTMRPAAYWKIWSDAIIRRIHLQVLRHVKRLAEADVVRP